MGGDREVGIDIRAYDMASAELERVGGALQDVGTAAEESGSKFGALGTAGSYLFKGVMLQAGFYAFQKMQEGFGFVADAAIGFNARLEQMQIAFTTMLGSSGAATQFLTQLKEFANRTPFQFQDIAQAAQHLIAMGLDAKMVIPDMRAIGDTVSALGGGATQLQSITDVFGKMLSLGKVDGRMMLELALNGVPAWQMLAKGLGVTTAEAQKMVGKGLVPAAKAVGILTDQMESRFGGLMAKQATTFNGAVSTIKDNLIDLISTAFEPMFKEMSKGAAQLALFLQTPQVHAFAIEVGNAVASVIRFLGPWAPLIAVAGVAFIALSLIVAVIAAIASPVALVIVGIAALAAGIVYLYNTNTQFRAIVAQAWAVVQTIISTTITVARAAIAGFSSFMKATWPFWTWAASVVTTVFGIIDGAVRTGIGVVRTVVGAVSVFFRQTWSFWTWAASIVTTYLGIIVGVVRVEIAIIAAVIGGFVSALRVVWGVWSGTIVPVLQGAWNTMVSIVRVAIGFIQGVISTAMALITAIFSGNWGKVLSIVTGVLGNLVNAIRGAFAAIISAIVGAAGQAAGAAGQLGSNILNGIMNFVSSIPGRVAGILGQLPGMVAHALQNAAGSVANGIGGLIPHFAVGAWNLPSDMMAVVHKGEMIIPSDLAARLRGEVHGGSTPTFSPGAASRGGGMNLTIQNYFGPSSVRSAQDIRNIANETALRARLLGMPAVNRSNVGGIGS